MANVFTDLAADIYAARQKVPREKIGGIRGCTVNADPTLEVAQGDIIRSGFAPEPTLNTSVTPSMTIPEGDDQAFTNKTMTLDQIANVQIPYKGEDVKHLNNGFGYETAYGLQIEQAMRKIANAIEAKVMLEVKNGAGNAVGTSGTTPFASNFDLIADAVKLLEDRGAPMDSGMLGAVINNAAANNLRKLDSLWQVNTSGSDDLLREGAINDLYGVMIRQSAQVASHTAGDAASYDVDLVAGYDAGDKTVHLDTGTGDFKQGDIITFSGDTSNRYVVAADQAGDGDLDITLNSGLVAAVADGEDVALQSSYTGNALFHRAAVELACRPLANPIGGDAAVDVMNVQDPVTGLIFQLSLYKGFKKAMIDITCLYGVKVWLPDYVVSIQG